MIMRYPYPEFDLWLAHTLIDSDPDNRHGIWQGGFYHGDTPLGESWGIVYTYTPNIAELWQESNWEVLIGLLDSEFGNSEKDQYSIERISHWATPLEYLMIALIDSEGHPTDIALVIYDLLIKLADYPILDDDHFSQLESEAQDSALTESLNSAVWSSDFYALFVDSSTEDQLFQYAVQHYDSEISESEGWLDDKLAIRIVNNFVWDVMGYGFMGI